MRAESEVYHGDGYSRLRSVSLSFILRIEVKMKFYSAS